MKLLLVAALAVVSLSAGCAPIPTKNTYQLFQAQGAGAKMSKNCSGGPSSAFHFPIGTRFANRVTVSLERFEGGVDAGLWANVNKATDVQFSPERLRVVFKGRQLNPVSTYEWQGHPRGGRNKDLGSSARFNVSIAPNEMVEVIVLPGAVRIDGQDKPLPAMRFDWVAITEIRLTQPLNC
jgi:hypothetical protein